MNRDKHINGLYKNPMDDDIGRVLRNGRFYAARELRYGEYEMKLKNGSIKHDMGNPRRVFCA